MLKYVLITLFYACSLSGFSQEIVHPNMAFKSHDTMDLLKIVGNRDNTTIVFRITSLIASGSFCVDPNTNIILPGGRKLSLEQAVNIPKCPDQHLFHAPGESLTFSLEFPPLPPGTLCIDIAEGCDDACFSLIGVVTDPELNNRLNQAHQAYATGKTDEALRSYIDILEQLSGKHLSIETGLYSYIIQIYHEKNDESSVKEWLDRLKNEKPPYHRRLLEDLEKAGIG